MTVATTVRQSPSGPIEDLPGGKGAVDSVFGRAGTVVAQFGDYEASGVANDSGVGGADVATALDALDFDVQALQAAFAALAASDVTNDSGVAGANVANALDTLAALIGASGVSSVFGRVGAVIAQLGDYTSSQVTNASTVAGATTTNALDSLATTIAGLVTGVSSVFGRVGVIVAQDGDYNSDQVDNVSTWSGANVTTALNEAANAILVVANQVAALVTGVSSVFGRVGAVAAQLGDYTTSLVTNSSGVAGATSTDALNALNGQVTTLNGQVATLQSQIGVVMWACLSTPAVNATRWFTRQSGTVGNTPDAGRWHAQVARTYTRIRMTSQAALVTDSCTFTLEVNGSPVALSVTVGPGQTNVTATGSIAVNAGDRLGMRLLQSGSESLGPWHPVVGIS